MTIDERLRPVLSVLETTSREVRHADLMSLCTGFGKGRRRVDKFVSGLMDVANDLQDLVRRALIQLTAYR